MNRVAWASVGVFWLVVGAIVLTALVAPHLLLGAIVVVAVALMSAAIYFIAATIKGDRT